jgi:hypothetical protein
MLDVVLTVEAQQPMAATMTSQDRRRPEPEYSVESAGDGA